ncbi:MAG: bacillithiol biosynthesis deacetylase BshB1 [Flavobacteriales bacterium]
MKLDILVFAAHPDDAEISACGTILKSIQQGYKVGIVDLTRGELGSRGSAELRDQESRHASEKMGLAARENLSLADGFFEINQESTLAVIRMIRKYQPDVVMATAPHDRHPDHGRANKLVREAAFYAGLAKIETQENKVAQIKWRPRAVYFYIQDQYIKPDFVVDVTPLWQQKIDVLQCYSSQFFDPKSSEPTTPISGKEFFDYLHGRALQMGRNAGFELGEGFLAEKTPGVEDIVQLK